MLTIMETKTMPRSCSICTSVIQSVKQRVRQVRTCRVNSSATTALFSKLESKGRCRSTNAVMATLVNYVHTN